jgi:hypothetical protein
MATPRDRQLRGLDLFLQNNDTGLHFASGERLCNWRSWNDYRMTRRDSLKIGTSAAVSATSIPSLAMPDETKAESYDEICFMRAVDLLASLRQKKISAREVMQAHLKQIERVNPNVNSIVTLVPEEQLMVQAAAADEAMAAGRWLGALHGLPVAVKDLHETNGIRTTFGSPLHKHNVPDFDCRVVQREKSAGAIVIGKTNVPEFGLGSQTSIRCLVRHATLTTQAKRAVEAREAGQWQSLAEWPRWLMGAIWAARYGILPTFAMLSVYARHRDVFRMCRRA